MICCDRNRNDILVISLFCHSSSASFPPLCICEQMIRWEQFTTKKIMQQCVRILLLIEKLLTNGSVGDRVIISV